MTCQSLGYTGGTLTCSSTCQRVTTGCTGSTNLCGNGLVNSGEQCDGTNLSGMTCQSLGYTGGTLTCSSTCQRVTTGCTGTTSAVCGDGLITGSEDCDGTSLGGYTCTSLGYSGGTLACNSTTCAFNTSGCTGTSGGSAPSFANIPSGTFSMGSPSSEPCRQVNGNMETQHTVTLTRAYSMMTTEVPRSSFTSVMGYSPSKSTGCTTTSCPVDTVSWHEAAAYANALSTSASLTQCYTCSGTAPAVTCAPATAYAGASIYTCPGYRLPTEAEWERAYRAGTTTAYYNGANSSSGCTSCSTVEANASAIAWYCGNSTTSWGWLVPSAVGQRTANTYGLYDMAGNVQEWVHDGGSFNLGSSAQTDPVISSSTSKILRGARNTGGYADGLRAAYRISAGPGHKTQNIGFRLARTGSSGSSATCGNGIINSGEQCDGTNLGGVTCATLGYGGGTLTCSSTCQRVTSGCTSGSACGNGVINSGEQCDGTNFGGVTCATLGYTGGTLTCSSTCQRNTVSCTGTTSSYCGDGVIGYGERCDGTSLGGQTCQTLGYTGGTLACSSFSCAWDTASCTGTSTCGNGVINIGEQCDGTNLASQTCQTLGYTNGYLSCDYYTCLRDVRGCYNATGGTWTAQFSNTGNNLNGVWGSSGSNIYAVGNGGTIRRYNGSSWGTVSSGTANHLYDVWGSSASNIYFVGANNTVLRYNGTNFTSINLGATYSCDRVWGSSASNVFVACGGTIHRYNGTSWSSSTVGTHPVTSVVQLWGSGSSNVYAVVSGKGSPGGNCGDYLVRFNGTTWLTLSGVRCPNGVWGASASDVHVIGYTGSKWTTRATESRFNGTSWTHSSLPVNVSGGMKIFGTAYNTIIGVSGYTAARFNGTTWLPMSTGLSLTQSLNAVWGLGKTFYAVGSGGIIRRYFAP